MNEKILIVEDEEAISKYLMKFLNKEGFQVKALSSGLNVINTTHNWQPDLIILDLMLPEKDGITCCKEIREFSDIPIIMLTAKVEEIDRIIGLRVGADDYVCKPFSAVELTLRIQQILKRVSTPISHDKLQLDRQTYIISYLKNSLELTHLEFLLFNLLYSNPSVIFSRDQIIEIAYPNRNDIFDRAIDSHVKNLRKKIVQINIDQTVIDSVYGAGYRYLPPKKTS